MGGGKSRFAIFRSFEWRPWNVVLEDVFIGAARLCWGLTVKRAREVLECYN